MKGPDAGLLPRYGRGWTNKPGSASVRMPRPTRRLSLARMPSLGAPLLGFGELTDTVLSGRRVLAVGPNLLIAREKGNEPLPETRRRPPRVSP